MKRLVLGMIAAFATLCGVQAQSTLAPGDVAIVGVSSDDPDEFGLLLLSDVLAGTELMFTDMGWSSSNSDFRRIEDSMTWMTPVNLPAGTLIIFHNDNTGTEASIGTITQGKMNGLSTGGDQILVFQGSTANPTFLFAIQFNGTDWEADATSSNTSALPPGLTSGTNAVAIPEKDNMIYQSDSIGTSAQLLAKICDPNNWTSNDVRTDFDVSENGRQGFLTINGTPAIRTYTSTYSIDFGQVQT
ncbi:MAG: hypothetical protein LPK45_07475, partial [Bacteroidota bacterium]|nr:hypothetical protein [Bacteroidota bacterium]MDX5430914.1 hypothetical protein [Bacteroidota bacterium]MDX5469661.1 hypothetical protein [Bacteroidota bacterium]